MVSDAIKASPYCHLIEHRLAANVKDAGRDDTDADGFIHVFRSLHNKSLYTEETKEIHLDWIKRTYGNHRIGWILSNTPLMAFFVELMRYEYFEQDGNVPVSLYHK
jgi:hypothetical protein